MKGLESHPEWDIIDCSKLQDYQECPRKFFYSHILGYSWESPNIHLEFGTAWHMAMEHLLNNGYSERSVFEAYELFYNYYRDIFSEADDVINSPKIPKNAERALRQYAEYYANDFDPINGFKVLYTEIASKVEIAEIKEMYFKIDSIVSDPNIGIHCLEHKTTSSLGSAWANQWKHKMQVGMYTHVLYCLYEPADVYGVMINGVRVTNAPRIKKNGTPYESDRDTEFMRVPVHFTPLQMQVWQDSTEYWYDSLKRDMDILSSSTDSEEVLKAFRPNGMACSSFSGCPYSTICAAYANPLRHLDTIPGGMCVKFWDPTVDLKTAKFVPSL